MKNKMLHSSTTIRLLNIDSAGCKEILLEKLGCLLKILSVDLELWQIEFYDGAFILGIGDPFKIEEYSQAIRDLFHRKEKAKFLFWLQTIFEHYNFGKKESLLLRVEYTTRFTRDSKGTWRLYLPDDTYYIGQDRPLLDNGLFPTVGQKYQRFLDEKIGKLYPCE